MADTQLSEHFWLSEFTASQEAERRGRPIVVNPDADDPVYLALKALAVHVLEPVRAHFGPVIISSGYRPGWLNQAIGGAANSQHTLGEAADFHCPGRSVAEVSAWVADLRNGIPFDQVIWEFNAWTHVSYGPRHRLEVLTAKHGPARTQYFAGLVPFTEAA